MHTHHHHDRKALMKRLPLILFTILALLSAASLFSIAAANAEGDPPVPCDQPTITVVVEEAWTEVIEHPGTPDSWTDLQWHNYTGNYDGEGAPPLDDPNWHAVPAQPGGQHAFEDHTPNEPYNVSNGNSGKGSWFLWTATLVPGWDAWTQTIEHPEVTEEQPNPAYPCDEEEPGEEPCPDDTLIFNPETGECDSTEEEPEEPNETVCEATPSLCEYPTESEEPQVKDPQTDQVRPKGPVYPTQTDPVCVAGAMVTKVLDANGNVVRSTTVNNHPSCAQETEAGEPFREEGM